MKNKSYDVDLFVIGAGSGGVRTARIAANHGARVAIAEKKFYGGTCVNVGCVPKKLMTYLASYATLADDAAGYGWHVSQPTLDWTHFVTQKNAEIERLNAVYARMLNNANVQIFWGAAQILDPHHVKVNEQIISAERILIATGSKAEVPDIKGAKEFGITSDDVFYLEEQPEKLIVIGAGYIGLEFAGIFNALGCEVHVIYRRDTILNDAFDLDVRTFLQNEMTKKGIIFHAAKNVKEISKNHHEITVELDDGTIMSTEQILFATGRTPNTEGLGLQALDIKLSKKGAVIVNKDEQTNIPSIYAVGDVTDRIALTPVALAEGHALADRLYASRPRYISYDNIPCAIFCDPNVAQAGLTEGQAREKFNHDIDIYKTDFRGMKMILAGRDERTFMKLVVQHSTDKVLGIHMVGAEAGEIIQGFATALVAGATKADFDRTIGIHPTAAEEFVTLRTKSV